MLTEANEKTVTNEEKAAMMVNPFVERCGSSNVSKERRGGKKTIKRAFMQEADSGCLQDVSFSMRLLRNVPDKTNSMRCSSITSSV